MQNTDNFKLKNERRKAGKASVDGRAFQQARYKRRIGFVGKDGESQNGCFGRVQPGSYNELVVGTSGTPKDLGLKDLYDDLADVVKENNDDN